MFGERSEKGGGYNDGAEFGQNLQEIGGEQEQVRGADSDP